MEKQNTYKGHVLLLPYPGQGHINPMLHFSRRLISKSLKTTLLNSVFNSKSMNFPSSIGPVNLDVISDGFDEGGFAESTSIDEYLSKLKTSGSKTLSDLILKYKNTQYPVDCVIYEPFLPWALDVAKEHGLLGAAFFTHPCCVDYIFYVVKRGMLEFPFSNMPVNVAGLPRLELRDMPSFFNGPNTYPAYFEMVLNQFSNTERADYIIINTFYELEKEVLDEMARTCPCPILTVGPTVPSMYLDKRIQNDDDYGLDLFPLEASISMNWLNSKPPKSVIYVAFGSIANLSNKQMEELFWGLEKTSHNFLWVIRDIEKTTLPQMLNNNLMNERWCIVNWCPQVKVLVHEATGCFLTHSGWNSTIEALSIGLPMVAMPQWTDQPTNAKFVEDVWKVGIRVKVDENGIVGREEVERCIREVMEGVRGKEFVQNCEKWKKLAAEAVSEGGSSDVDIEAFVSKVVNFKLQET